LAQQKDTGEDLPVSRQSHCQPTRTSQEVLFCIIKMIKIRAIPDIPPKIIEAAKNEDLIIFFGAGVSQIIGCPSWQGFARAYLDEVLKQKLINHFEYDQLLKKDPRMALTICQKILEESGKAPPNPADVLKGDPKKVKKHKIYDHLYKFNAIFVTTNFDGHMDAVIIKNRSLPPVPTASVTSGSTVQNVTVPQIFFTQKMICWLLL